MCHSASPSVPECHNVTNYTIHNITMSQNNTIHNVTTQYNTQCHNVLWLIHRIHIVHNTTQCHDALQYKVSQYILWPTGPNVRHARTQKYRGFPWIFSPDIHFFDIWSRFTFPCSTFWEACMCISCCDRDVSTQIRISKVFVDQASVTCWSFVAQEERKQK